MARRCGQLTRLAGPGGHARGGRRGGRVGAGRWGRDGHDSEKAAKESAAEPESSPDSPLVQNEPPHEDEEQPVVLTRG